MLLNDAESWWIERRESRDAVNDQHNRHSLSLSLSFSRNRPLREPHHPPHLQTHQVQLHPLRPVLDHAGQGQGDRERQEIAAAATVCYSCRHLVSSRSLGGGGGGRRGSLLAISVSSHQQPIASNNNVQQQELLRRSYDDDGKRRGGGEGQQRRRRRPETLLLMLLMLLRTDSLITNHE